MSKTSKQKPAAETPKRGNAGWLAHKEAIASRNEQAHKDGRARRQKKDDLHAAQIREADLRERAELAKLRPR